MFRRRVSKEQHGQPQVPSLGQYCPVERRLTCGKVFFVMGLTYPVRWKVTKGIGDKPGQRSCWSTNDTDRCYAHRQADLVR